MLETLIDGATVVILKQSVIDFVSIQKNKNRQNTLYKLLINSIFVYKIIFFLYGNSWIFIYADKW